ncbi:DUF7558 family protein [Haloparvum sp. PAK95]|uniref:DUF7558 family protein n=1 Tax=Haloparvum sp. PAK95 TaxID=3418962 RepID=UPI003D2F4E58
MAGRPVSTPTRTASEAADAHWLCLLRFPAWYRDWRAPYQEAERVTHPICVDCDILVDPDPDDHHACDGRTSSSTWSRGPSHSGWGRVTSTARSTSMFAVTPTSPSQ